MNKINDELRTLVQLEKPAKFNPLNSIIHAIMRRHFLNFILCGTGLHRWSNWSEPISGEKAVAILIATGESIKEEVMLQERRCMRCNKAEYKHIKIKQ